MVVAEISFQQLANLGFCSTAFRPRSERSVAVVKVDARRPTGRLRRRRDGARGDVTGAPPVMLTKRTSKREVHGYRSNQDQKQRGESEAHWNRRGDR
jgi:hypothetical protein